MAVGTAITSHNFSCVYNSDFLFMVPVIASHIQLKCVIVSQGTWRIATVLQVGHLLFRPYGLFSTQHNYFSLSGTNLWIVILKNHV